MEAEGTFLRSISLRTSASFNTPLHPDVLYFRPWGDPKPGLTSDATGPRHWLQSEQVLISKAFCIFFECYSFPAKRHRRFPLASSLWKPHFQLFLPNSKELIVFVLLKAVADPTPIASSVLSDPGDPAGKSPAG